jgi:hypothetical protein
METEKVKIKGYEFEKIYENDGILIYKVFTPYYIESMTYVIDGLKINKIEQMEIYINVFEKWIEEISKLN